MVGGGTHHVHLELGPPVGIDIHSDDEKLTIGHLDAELPAIGAHHGTHDGVIAERGQRVGDPAKVLQRDRTKRGTVHWSCSASKAVSASSGIFSA